MNIQTMGDFPDGEWDFSRMFSMEEPDFTPELLGQYCSFPQDNGEGLQFTIPPDFFPAPEADVISMAGNESLFYSWNTLNPNLHFDSQESSKNSNCSSSVFLPSSSHESYFFNDSNHIQATNDNSVSMDEKTIGLFMPFPPEIAMAETACMNGDMNSDKIGDLDNNLQPAANTAQAKGLQLKRKLDDGPEPIANTLDDTKKKPRITRNVQKSKKSVQPKKNQRSTPNIRNEEEESNAGPDGQSSSSCSSEDDNASKDSDSKVSEKVLNSSGKTRASRGAATDPQSLYARKRRERINERLKILQNIVPNGTKVDISTMLEEAVHYVKFLQLQIKLLSSDDLWMYAPLAYSGIDIGLDQKLSMLL
ncbi:hypothetical protein DKX38_020453 [Salix brachista]|uniref:BHLH domain-containing protein n=1 Tax=Salix brachista TaxID=2182728 RepID=A0A5N5K732_9ROSI|nr:hypothetical protein DKX38_020453 [Salix brachista]